MIDFREKKQIITFKEQKPLNVWHFRLINCLIARVFDELIHHFSTNSQDSQPTEYLLQSVKLLQSFFCVSLSDFTFTCGCALSLQVFTHTHTHTHACQQLVWLVSASVHDLHKSPRGPDWTEPLEVVVPKYIIKCSEAEAFVMKDFPSLCLTAPRVILLSFCGSDTLRCIKFYVCDYNWPVAAENRLLEAWQEIITVPFAALYSDRHGTSLHYTESEESSFCPQREGAPSLLCVFQLLVSEVQLLARRETLRGDNIC